MSIFDQREKAAELEFVHSQERSFRQRARRNRLLAIWAAEILGKPAGAYLDELVDTDYRDGETGVLLKLSRDFDTASIIMPGTTIRAKLDEFNLSGEQAE